MATTVTTVDIKLKDYENNEITYKLNNPKSDLTLATIKEVVNSAIHIPTGDEGDEMPTYWVDDLICSRKGFRIIEVVEAKRVVTTREETVIQ